MLVPVIDHVWQSTLVVIAAAAATLLLRRHGARWRYWIWFAASMKFLVPFALIAALGAQLSWRGATPESRESEWRLLATRALRPTSAFEAPVAPPATADSDLAPSSTLPPALTSGSGELLAQEAPDDGTSATIGSGVATESASASRSRSLWTEVVLGVWALGTCLLLMRWGRRWLSLHRLARRARRLEFDWLEPGFPELRSCRSIVEPGVFGVFKPVLLIPEGIVDRLTRPQLEVIVQHERSHIERRDNLTAALHMLVEAVFWFHPFVWWIGARLIDERERACDEAVLEAGVDPDHYASGLIEVCSYYVDSPLLCAAGVGGGSLEARVERIAENEPLPAPGRAARAALVAAPGAMLLVPLAIGLLGAPVVRGQLTNAGDAGNGLLECVNTDVLASLVLFSFDEDTVYTAGVPEEMAGIAVPAEFDWIGSMRRSGPTDPAANQLTAAYRTDLSIEDARAVALSALEADGWAPQGAPSPLGPRGAFRTAMPPQPDLVCLGDRAINLNVNELDDVTYVTYDIPTNPADTSCGRDARSPFLGGALAAYMPQLEFPRDPVTGEPVRPRGSGISSRANSQLSHTEIRHNASLDELAAHLATQLVEQGWTADVSWVGATTAGSAWSSEPAPGTRVQGTLAVTRTSDSRYTIMFRVVALP